MTPAVFFKACFIAGFLLLTGCQATPQADKLRQQQPVGLTQAHKIAGVPFYPQQQYYCGPTTLSEVFTFYGTPVSADDLAAKIFIPDKQGSLQLEMVSATRQYGFLPYAEKGTLEQLFGLIDDDLPVIVLQNLSIQMLPQWHYAVVTGYDLSAGTVILHTGVTPDHEMSFELFEKTWARADYWLMAPLAAGKSSEYMDAFTYISAAYDMLKTGNTEPALRFLQTATQQWPNQWLGYFLLANHFLEIQPAQATEWFEKGYHAGQYQAAYLNNFAHVLARQGCTEKANRILDAALERFADNSDLQNTRQQIRELSTPSRCEPD